MQHGSTVPETARDRTGRVVLVGAGPGAPGLLTLAALEALRVADVILYDRLAGPSFRRFVRPSTELVDVGKRPGTSSATQAEICRRLVEEARSGRIVVRVKGGDPFVFGRGYEEVLACLDAGVRVEVVPGVSSALAAPELAGVPLTHRGFAPGFMVVSGHEDPTKARPPIEWAELARLGTPLVILMGVATAAAHARVLVDAGMDAGTPVVAVEHATTESQRTVHATLGDCGAVFAAASVESPAVIVVGANAGLARAWDGADVSSSFAGSDVEVRALSGWVIAVAGAGDDSDALALAACLGSEGATVVAARKVPAEGGSRIDCLVLTTSAPLAAADLAAVPLVVASAPGEGVDLVVGPDPAAVAAALVDFARRRGAWPE